MIWLAAASPFCPAWVASPGQDRPGQRGSPRGDGLLRTARLTLSTDVVTGSPRPGAELAYVTPGLVAARRSVAAAPSTADPVCCWRFPTHCQRVPVAFRRSSARAPLPSAGIVSSSRSSCWSVSIAAWSRLDASRQRHPDREWAWPFPFAAASFSLRWCSASSGNGRTNGGRGQHGCRVGGDALLCSTIPILLSRIPLWHAWFDIDPISAGVFERCPLGFLVTYCRQLADAAAFGLRFRRAGRFHYAAPASPRPPDDKRNPLKLSPGRGFNAQILMNFRLFHGEVDEHCRTPGKRAG